MSDSQEDWARCSFPVNLPAIVRATGRFPPSVMGLQLSKPASPSDLLAALPQIKIWLIEKRLREWD